MTFRQKQKMAGLVGAVGGVLLLVAVSGLIGRWVLTPAQPARVADVSEERSVEAGTDFHTTASGLRTTASGAPVLAIPRPKPIQAAAMAGVMGAATAPSEMAADTVTMRSTASSGTDEMAHYPLGVGRYWVYLYHERDTEVVTEVERQIVRQEARQGASDLFFFADGTIAYAEEGKIYEMGSNGGVNIIPIEKPSASGPIRYRSQGLQIEKWVAANDTAVVIDGHRFERCLEVVTRFRPDESGGNEVSYSSFYASGIGLVGRQKWPTDALGTLAVTLSEYGTRQPPSTDGQL